MTDIVSRLRQELPYHADSFAAMNDLRFEAAAHIERLEAENRRLEGAYRHAMICFHGAKRSTDPAALAEEAVTAAKEGRGPIALALRALDGGEDGE